MGQSERVKREQEAKIEEAKERADARRFRLRKFQRPVTQICVECQKTRLHKDHEGKVCDNCV